MAQRHVMVLSHRQNGKKKRTYIGSTDDVCRALLEINLAVFADGEHAEETRAAVPHWRPVLVTGPLSADACAAFIAELRAATRNINAKSAVAARLGLKYGVVVYSRRVLTTRASEYAVLRATLPPCHPLRMAYKQQRRRAHDSGTH